MPYLAVTRRTMTSPLPLLEAPMAGTCAHSVMLHIWSMMDTPGQTLSSLRNPPTASVRGWRIAVLIIVALACSTQAVRASDPVLYDVTIAPTGDGALDTAVHDASTLISLRESAPVGPFALVARANGDRERFVTVMGSFGYYAGTVTMTIDGRKLDDPGLVDALDMVAAGTKVPVAVALTPGPEFHLRRVELRG